MNKIDNRDAHSTDIPNRCEKRKRYRHERNIFVFLVTLLFPMISVILISGLGLSIWITQMLFGP